MIDAGAGTGGARRQGESTIRLTVGGPRPPLRVRECELVVLEGPDAGTRFRVAGPLVRVGSAPDNEVVLNDTAVSRHHVSITEEPGGHLLSDRGSRNGTLVNGVRSREAFLDPGAILVLGSTRLQFRPRQTVIPVTPSTDGVVEGLIGGSPPMRELFGYLKRVAVTDLPVILTGETGTGKEVLARALHSLSLRSAQPFVVFDCANVEATLMGATLFGHSRGAFTGAHESRKGAFLSAHRGTLFIDEIGDLPPDLQPKLLRALERKEVQPLGGDQPTGVDVRVVAATHRDLESMVDEGRFREDLFYRLAGLILEVPPLRERCDDIEALVRHFLDRMAPATALEPEALSVLRNHDWPGNVRELRNVIERAVALHPAPVIAASALRLGRSRAGRDPGAGSPDAPASTPAISLEEAERRAIVAALEATGWNKTGAARILGIARITLREKIERYGIKPP